MNYEKDNIKNSISILLYLDVWEVELLELGIFR